MQIPCIATAPTAHTHLLVLDLQLPQVLLVPGLNLVQHLLVSKPQLHHLQLLVLLTAARMAAVLMLQGMMQPHIYAAMLLLLRVAAAVHGAKALHFLPQLLDCFAYGHTLPTEAVCVTV
jgi:hypothetical protein